MLPALQLQARLQPALFQETRYLPEATFCVRDERRSTGPGETCHEGPHAQSSRHRQGRRTP